MKANWRVTGFGAALNLDQGRVGPGRFRVDLITGTLEEVSQTLRAGLKKLSPPAEVPVREVPDAPLVPPSSISFSLVAEVFDQNGEVADLPPLVLLLAYPPGWIAPELTLELLVPSYAHVTYRNYDFVIEMPVAENCWQRLGTWPVAEWPDNNNQITFTMTIPDAPASLLSVPLRAQLIELR